MATTAASTTEICQAAREASRTLATLDRAAKDRALEAMASALEERSADILEANARDMEAGRVKGLDAALLDRLDVIVDATEDAADGSCEDVERRPGKRGRGRAGRSDD